MNTTEMNFLSFLKSNDVYDPDKIAADAELIRRHYLKNGYADFQLVSTDVRFDEAKEGWVVTFTVNEGQPYRVGTVGFDSRVSQVSPEILRDEIETQVGDIYSAEAVEKTLTNMTNAAVRRGQPFVIVRPTGARNPATQTVDIGFVVEEGPRVYIERINVRGNTRTRDYVIRRELDIGEGDPVQQGPHGPGGASPERPRLFQEGSGHDRAWHRGRSGGRQHRRRGSADRCLLRVRRLLDRGWRDR
jgi:outer membrane protein insertion porin family